MTLRRRCGFTLVTSVFLVAAALVNARGQQFPAPDPERGFTFGDTDLDGKLTLDEFRDLLLNGPQIKKAAAKKRGMTPPMIEPLFQRLDTDHERVADPVGISAGSSRSEVAAR